MGGKAGATTLRKPEPGRLLRCRRIQGCAYGSKAPTLAANFFPSPRGVLFVRDDKEPWMQWWSANHRVAEQETSLLTRPRGSGEGGSHLRSEAFEEANPRPRDRPPDYPPRAPFQMPGRDRMIDQSDDAQSHRQIRPSPEQRQTWLHPLYVVSRGHSLRNIQSPRFISRHPKYLEHCPNNRSNGRRQYMAHHLRSELMRMGSNVGFDLF